MDNIVFGLAGVTYSDLRGLDRLVEIYRFHFSRVTAFNGFVMVVVGGDHTKQLVLLDSLSEHSHLGFS